MLPGEIAFLVFVIVAFVVFGLTLGRLSHIDTKLGRRTGAPSRPQRDRLPAGAHLWQQGADG